MAFGLSRQSVVILECRIGFGCLRGRSRLFNESLETLERMVPKLE